MAIERNPNDPYYQDQTSADPRRSTRLDQELQADPEMTEGRLGGGRIAAFAIAVVVLLGAVYYGMNMSSTSPSSTASQSSPAAQSSAQNNPAAPGLRDVTPNREPGTTTGSAPAAPQSPASPPSNSSTNPSR